MPNTERQEFLQPHIEGMSRRDMLELQDPMELLRLRDQMLDTLSNLEHEIHLVNDVLSGLGVETEEALAHFLPEDMARLVLQHGFYDADDGTVGAVEHPEDDKWIDKGRE